MLRVTKRGAGWSATLVGVFGLTLLATAPAALAADPIVPAAGPAVAAGAVVVEAGGIIRGRVVDSQGGVLPGVIVTARPDGGSGAPITSVSDAEGRYELLVPPGKTYAVTAELSGFATFIREAVPVRIGVPGTLDIQLEIGGLQETVQVLGNEVTRSRNTIERVQDVPQSISIVSGTELQRLEAVGIAAITQRVANVSWNFGNQRTSSLSIRGVGRQGQTEAQDPSVGVIVDGVAYAYNALTSQYDFTDVDTVEVTRGPQGTLLGKNTSLGVINITTKRPTFTPNAEGSLTFGQWGTVLGRFSIGGPLSQHIAWRGTVSVSRGNGDIINKNNRDITYTNTDRVSGRGQVLWVPTPTFSARIGFDLQPRAGETTNGRTINTPTPLTLSNGTATNLTTDASTRLARRWFTQQSTYSYENDYLYGGGGNFVNNDTVRPLVTGSGGVSAELTWTRRRHTLTSITAYKNYHFNAVNDDGTPFDIQRNAGGFWNDYDQVTQEVRLTSPRNQLVDYQAGLFYIDVRNSVDYQRVWGNDAGAWYATPVQYARLDADSAGRYLMQQSLDRLSMSFNSPTGLQKIHNHGIAPYAQANWHFGPKLVLTTGGRLTQENRTNRGTTFIRDQGFGADLNPVAVNGVQLGGFNSAANGTLQPGNSAVQLQVADRVAQTYFGVTATGGVGTGYAALTAAQRQQVADAKAIRAAQLGVIFDWREAEPYKAWQPSYLVSPLVKLNEQVNVYGSWQYGEKAGISQFTNGVSNLTKPEKSNAYEAGLKSVLLGKTLLLNADYFFTNIKDYQQGVRVYDAYTTELNNNGLLSYTTATGSVDKVRVKGVEVDGVYAGLPHTNLRFAGALTDAVYVSFPNSAQPVENGFTGAPPYQDVSGQRLPGAARFTFNVGGDVRWPVGGDKNVHASFNTAYSGSYKSDNALSAFSTIPAFAKTDLSVGFGKQKLEVNLIFKNVFNDLTPQTQTWNSYTPAVPRWFGLQFVTKM